MFADDTVLFAQSPAALQSMLNDLERYCNTWSLSVNTNKTKIMIFERGRSTSYDFIICGKTLELVQSFKYLGIHFFKNGSWYQTQKRLAQHSAFALHNLFTVFNQIELSTSDKCHLFDSLVGSILNYNAAVWGSHESKDIELIHCKFLRKVLKVKKSTNLEGLYGELGRYPMRITRRLIMIKYWIKLLSTENPLLINMYRMLASDAESDISYNEMNWAYNIKTILNEIGMANLWHNQAFIAINYLTIKQRILDIYKQSWYAKINNSGRLSSYCLFKHEFESEKYLSCISENKYRIAYSRLRLSSHDLAIETGRYTNIERKYRKCLQCNMGAVESEYHFILVCPKYRDLRYKFFSPYFCRWPNIHKFVDLMSSKSPRTINLLAKFTYFAFKLRI